MSVTDLVARHWNDALTLASSGAAAVIGYYQIQHYRAQTPNLSIIEVSSAEHRAKQGRNGMTEGGGYDENTEYHVKFRIGNDGREGTTVTKAQLLVEDEVLDMERYIERTLDGISGHKGITRSETEDELRIPGQDVRPAVFGAIGEPVENRSEPVEGTLRVESIDGDVAEHFVTFEPFEE